MVQDLDLKFRGLGVVDFPELDSWLRRFTTRYGVPVQKQGRGLLVVVQPSPSTVRAVGQKSEP